MVNEAGNSIQILEQNIEGTGFIMLRGSALRQKKKVFCNEKEPYLSSRTYWAVRRVPQRHHDIGGFAEKLEKKTSSKDEWRDLHQAGS